MVTIKQEETVSFETRHLYSGSGASAQWTSQHRKVATTTYRVKGTEAEVDTYLQTKIPSTYSPTGTNTKTWTKRKSDGPWWEADYTETTGEEWENDVIEDAN